MSRWLSSVNNLLENLDGQAETVAETVAEQATTTGISSNLRRLNDTFANNASALAGNITKSNSKNTRSNIDSHNEKGSYDDDSDFSENDDFGDDEEFTTDEDDDFIDAANHGTFDADEIGGSNKNDPKETANYPHNLQTNITPTFQPTEPSLGEVHGEGRRQLDHISSPAAASTKESATKKQENVIQKPGTIGKSSSYKSKSGILSASNQISSTQESLQQSVLEPDDELTKVEVEEKKKDTLSEMVALEKNADSAINSSFVKSDLAPIAAEKLLPTIKSTSENNESVSPQMVKTQQSGNNIRASNTNIIATRRKNQEHDMIPRRPMSPQRSVAPVPINDNLDTKSQSGRKEVQKEKHQLDEIKLLKKQQQQHQQVLSSKNRTIQSLQSQLTKLREELTQGGAEHEKLNQRTKDLDKKLKASEREIEAQAKELLRAGEEMEQIRTNAKEEREDLIDDHEDELEDVQRSHQEALDKVRQDYESTIAEWKDRYESEESLRQQEGGDSIRELQDANKREREALKKLAEVTEERTSLETKLKQVVGHEIELKQQVESSLESAETVAAREQRARDELDEATAVHAKQMAQRQRREAELEQTILEMGSALTLAKQQLQEHIALSPEGEATLASDKTGQMDGSYYKEQFEQVAEELETVRVQLTMETQRREALQQELNEVSKEREQDFLMTQSRQHQNDRKVTDLESTIHRLKASLRATQQPPRHSNDTIGRTNDDDSVEHATETQKQISSIKELEGAKQEIANLSEQLFRQQALTKNAKSEILALKGRLQAANTRAEEAEKAIFNQKNLMQPRSRKYDVEDGSANNTAPAFSVRRRVKGGSNRGVRSIRSALPCLGSGRASANGSAAMEQLALTIDAIDSWMVDTGSFMRHEPFARLGLLIYLVILHLWSFALVVFHTTEVEHGDFGSMDSNPRHWREHT